MKLAIWQTGGFLGDPAANIAAIEQTARTASAAGATLLLCPECWLGGYNIPELCAELAEPRNGPWATRIADIAKKHNVAIIYGYAERDPDSGAIYNAVQAISPNGNSLVNYRKTHLFGDFERGLYRPGDGFAAPFELAGWRVGLLICYDVEFPETVRSLALAGANLILIPTALTGEYACVPDIIVPARAVENQVFIAYCNHAGAEGDMRFIGKSRLAGPDDSAIVAAGGGEALLIATITRETIAATAAIFPYRSERRPALYAAIAQPERTRRD
ncbi:carbon-nitrogen hydrolase family protein [Acidiphilium sp. AL]|uniref:Carbon-nitrogen hydrolase family protein n=1 Tax=Acidiphilium iwatense TaxID=768198 RepID=A0ABS9E1A0_9PROT|nr:MULTISPECIES: carbon-nitrogen hydrolase family protein [Acidiphilium]MCF3948781.1 carbon-nitrogen hydrolase family protein [Acidiphilium iwatense]MCU4162171.1 carbon-nitrogen hydrolase family protein [Acidiphilium sp. AL]